MNLMEESTHTMGKVWVPIYQVLHIPWVLFPGTSFPNFLHSMVSTVFPRLWEINEKTRAFLMWWKKATIIWEKYEHQFPRFSPYNEFCCVFLYYGKLIGKPMHFLYDEVYRRKEIVWGLITYTMGKVLVPISQVHPIQRVLLHFPVL